MEAPHAITSERRRTFLGRLAGRGRTVRLGHGEFGPRQPRSPRYQRYTGVSATTSPRYRRSVSCSRRRESRRIRPATSELGTWAELIFRRLKSAQPIDVVPRISDIVCGSLGSNETKTLKRGRRRKRQVAVRLKKLDLQARELFHAERQRPYR